MTIDDKILRKLTNKLSDSFEPDERLVAYDTGREASALRNRVTVAVSTHAIYITAGLRTVVRVRHEDVVDMPVAAKTQVMLVTHASMRDQRHWCIYVDHVDQQVPKRIHEYWLERGSRDAVPPWRIDHIEEFDT